MKEEISINAKRLTVHYAAAFAVYFSGFCMVRSFIAVYLSDRGFSYTQVGLITAIHTFFTAAIQPNFASILNRFPKISLKQFISLCCIPSILCSVLTFILPANMAFFLPIYILFGLFEIGLQSLMVSLGMEYVNAGVPINAGIGRGFGSAGYALSNVILGMLIVRFGSPISHTLNIVMMVLLFVLLLTLPDPQTIGENSGKKRARSEPSDSLGVFIRNNWTFFVFSFSMVFIFFGHSVVNTYLPNVAAQFGLGSDFVGWMNGLAAGLELIPMMFYAKITRKFSPFLLLKISAIAFSVKILTAALARNGAILAASEAMQIFAYATFATASIFFANQIVEPRNRVTAQGLLVGTNEAGFMIGGLVGGGVLDHMGIRPLLWMGVAMTVIGSGIMLWAIRRFSRSAAQTGA